MLRIINQLRGNERYRSAVWWRNYFVAYTIAFVLLSFMVFASFWLFKITFIWNPDGSGQHIKALTYYGTWLRDILKSVLLGNPQITEFNFSLGLGADIIQTLHYYVIGDPLNLVAALCPYKLYPHLYNLLVLVRLYLAGITFSLFCMYKKDRSRYALFGGSFVYIFCGFALLSVRHPFFLNPFYQLPLILLGVEHIIDGKKPYILIFSVAIAATSNFFFFYILVLLTIIYVLGRMIAMYYRSLKQALVPVLKIGIFSFAGVLLGAAIFLPVVMAFLSDGRLSAEVNVPSLYSITYYKNMLAGFAGTSTSVGSWTLLCFSVVALLAVFMLFRQKKQHQLLKAFFILGTLFLCLPYVGHIFNGMSYVANRWSFAYSMTVAYILVEVWPSLTTISKRDFRYLTICLGVYGLLCCLLTNTSSHSGTFVPLFIGLFALCLIFIVGENKRAHANIILIVSALISIIFTATSLYSPFIKNNVNDYMTVDEYWQMYYASPDGQVLNLNEENQDPEITRYAANTNDWNAALTYGTNSIEYYWSLSNPNVTQYRIEFNERENVPYFYKGFDSSTILTNLASVKYYAVAIANNELVPYGYEKVSENYAYEIYENSLALPLGYTYDSYMQAEDYQNLSSIEKQEAQLQSVILEYSDSFTAATPSFTYKEMPYAFDASAGEETSLQDSEASEAENIPAQTTVETEDNANVNTPESSGASQAFVTSDETAALSTDTVNLGGVIVSNNSFIVTQTGASVKLLVDGLPNSETILSIENLHFVGANKYDLYQDNSKLDPLDQFTQEQLSWMTPLEQYSAIRQNQAWTEPTTAQLKIGVQIGERLYWKGLTVATPNYLYYNNRHDFDINLGYSEDAATVITIIFPKLGIYTFNDLSVYCLPMDQYEERVSALQQDTLENIAFQNDTLTGTISLEDPKILCLSIPYSSGWSATVDGEPAELMQANTMYMALELTEGEHNVELHYETPYLRLGMLLSGCTLLGIVLSILVTIGKRRKNKLSNK